MDSNLNIFSWNKLFRCDEIYPPNIDIIESNPIPGIELFSKKLLKLSPFQNLQVDTI